MVKKYTCHLMFKPVTGLFQACLVSINLKVSTLPNSMPGYLSKKNSMQVTYQKRILCQALSLKGNVECSYLRVHKLERFGCASHDY